jgi:hypothetical protein
VHHNAVWTHLQCERFEPRRLGYVPLTWLTILVPHEASTILVAFSFSAASAVECGASHTLNKTQENAMLLK